MVENGRNTIHDLRIFQSIWINQNIGSWLANKNEYASEMNFWNSSFLLTVIGTSMVSQVSKARLNWIPVQPFASRPCSPTQSDVVVSSNGWVGPDE